MMAEIARKPVFVVVSLCMVFVCAWVVFTGSKKSPCSQRVSYVALSSSGRWLAAGTASGVITVWDQTHRYTPKQVVFSHGSLNDLQFSPNEDVLAIAAGDLGLYAVAESAAPRLLRSDHENYGSARFSPDGQTLLVISGGGLIETIDVHTGASRLKVCCSSIYGEAVFTPDGQKIANAGHWPRLWDARSGQLIGRLTASREFYTFGPIAFDASGEAILMGSQDGRVHVWDLNNRQPITVSPPQPAYVDTLRVSKNGWVIFAGFGNGVQLWNPDTGQRRSLQAARPTSNLVLGPSDTSIIFGTADGTIEFWDVMTKQRLSSTKVPTGSTFALP